MKDLNQILDDLSKYAQEADGAVDFARKIEILKHDKFKQLYHDYHDGWESEHDVSVIKRSKEGYDEALLRLIVDAREKLSTKKDEMMSELQNYASEYSCPVEFMDYVRHDVDDVESFENEIEYLERKVNEVRDLYKELFV